MHRVCEEALRRERSVKLGCKAQSRMFRFALVAEIECFARCARSKARIQLGAYLDISQSLNAEVRHTNVTRSLSGLTICYLKYLAMGNCAQRKLGVAGFPLVTRSE